MADISILDVFEPKVRRNIIEFCKDLNETCADLYVVMARKAACFVSVLEDLGLLTLHGNIISERAMDCGIEWRKYSKVIIIDDVVISGTTLHQTIKKIESANGSIRIDLFVLGVNNDWYAQDVLKRADGTSYIHAPIRRIENAECIRLSGDIVRMLANYPRPYNIDYPIYNKFRLNTKDFAQVMTLPGWKVSEVSSFSNRQNDIVTHAFIPEPATLNDCGSVYQTESILHSLIKIRTYCRIRTDKKHDVYIMTIVPMLILPPMSIAILNKVFEEVAGQSSAKLAKILNSNAARLRFVQFVLADLLARRFIQTVDNLLGIRNSTERDYGSLRYLFPLEVISLVCDIADKFTGVVNGNIPYVNMSSVAVGYCVTELLDVNEVLTRPFLEMYDRDELQSRRLVREHGANVFNKSEYSTAIDRLNRGVTFVDLLNRLSGVSEHRRYMLVSAFLDKSIDEGLVVPITVEKDGVVFRAFRHGEDVQFGRQEERLCYDMLNMFSKQIHRKDIPKLLMEKMLVLLFQLGEGGVFKPIQTSTGSYGHISGKKIPDLVSIKYYLQGPIAVRLPHSMPFAKQYLSPDDKAEWLSSKLATTPGSPVVKGHLGRFIFDEERYLNVSTGDNEIVIDRRKTKFAKEVGQLFGRLIDNGTKKTAPAIDSDVMVMLTSSLETKNVIGAMAAEINICNKTFINEEGEGIIDIIDAVIKRNMQAEEGFGIIRRSKWYQALNDGIRKFRWYCDKEGYRIINNITAQFEDDLYKTTWENLWSLNMEQKGEAEKPEIIGMAYIEGLWLLSVHACYLMLYCLVLDKKGRDYHKSIDKIDETYALLTKYAYREYVRNILSLIVNFKAHSRDSGDAEKMISIIHKRLIQLFNRCHDLLDKANIYYENLCRIPRIQYYNHALFIESRSVGIDAILSRLHEDIRIKINQSEVTKGTGIILLKRIDEIVPLSDQQFVFFSYNERGLYWLLELAKEVSVTGDENAKMVLFPSLNRDCHVKHVLGSRIEARSFESLFLYTLNDKIVHMPFDNDTLYVMASGRNDILSLHPEFKCYERVYEETCHINFFSNWEYKMSHYKKKNVSVDIGIITIVDEEAFAVRKGFEMDSTVPTVIGNKYYDCCEYVVHGKTLKIVHFQNAVQGSYRMATSVCEVINIFKPKIMILLGIAGGVSSNVNVGDVVLASEVFYYDSRKIRRDGQEDMRLRSYKITKKSSHQVTRYRSLWNESEMTSANPFSFRLHVGPIGTGEAVISDENSMITQKLKQLHSKICAVETEAAGFSDAIEEFANDTTDFYIVRGISDKADANKDDKYRRIASENAVAVLKDFIAKILCPPKMALG